MSLVDQVEVESRPSREVEFYPRPTIFLQFRALFLKDLTLQWRSWKTNVCQLVTPLIFIVFAGLMQVIVNLILVKHAPPIPGTENPFPPINVGKMLSCMPINTSPTDPYIAYECDRDALNFFTEISLSQVESILRYAANRTTGGIRDYIDYLMFWLQELDSVAVEPCQKMLFDLPLFYVGVSGDVPRDILGNLTASGSGNESRSGLVGAMVPEKSYFEFSLDFEIDYESNSTEDICPVVQLNNSLVLPQFWWIDSRSGLNEHLVHVVKDYNNWANLSASATDQYERTYGISPLSKDQYDHVMTYIKNGHLDRVKPRGGIFIDKFENSSSLVDIHYTLVADEIALYKLDLLSDLALSSGNLSQLEIDINRRNGFVNMVDNAILKKLLGVSGGENLIINTYVMPIPLSTPTNVTIDISSILGGILYPFAYSFLIPVFMAAIVKDKHERHLIMMEQNGLSRWTYLMVTYTFNYLLYIPVALEVAFLSWIFELRLFTQTSGLVLFLTFFLWGHAEVVLGFFLSNFFQRPRTATIVGYLLVIAGIITALLLEALQVLPQDKTPLPIYMMYPPFAFYRLLYFYINACIEMRCYTVDIFTDDNGFNVVTIGMLYLGISTVVLFVLSIYLSYVFPGEYGVRKSPFFPITDVYKSIKSLCVSKKPVSLELDKSSPETRVGLEEEDDVDIDVQVEEDSIMKHFPNTAPMVLYQLRKEYPGAGGGSPFVAVHSISLTINRNECFGLLGPNGAGKTTLISVLTGLYEPTSGTARIAGYDLSTDINSIHHHLGVCPQFDIHHAELSSQEHLLFYARLKGVKWGQEKAVVTRALQQVNLYDARKRRSKNLSGGMRRRLSVAMACIGNPDILILDEPTTGLDPASRRQVWEVIEAVKEGRSVILTTHAMEEADHLCTRIGIMNFGKLRCLGTQTRLKARFGSGYQIAFNCAPGHVKEVENFVQTKMPKFVHTETYADTCSFKMAKEDLKVSEMFSLINGEKTRLGILDWGVKMTTLEDVFLKIVKRHSDNRTQAARSCLPTWIPLHTCMTSKGNGR